MSDLGALRLDGAAEADIPFVMATERLDGYEEWVGRWDEARHRAAMADGRHAYFVGRDRTGRELGFVIVRDWASPERASLVKRVAVRDPGRGIGRSLAAAAVEAVFGRTEAFRLAVGVFPENERAIRADRALGFVPEGVSRGSAFFAGRHRDGLALSILRPEWQARRAGRA